MSKSITPRTVADVTGVAASASIRITDLEEASYWVLGTFVATVFVQTSPDDTNWIDLGASFAIPTKTVLPTDARFVRINCTAFTSGDIESQVSGRDNDSKG